MHWLRKILEYTLLLSVIAGAVAWLRPDWIPNSWQHPAVLREATPPKPETQPSSSEIPPVASPAVSPTVPATTPRGCVASCPSCLTRRLQGDRLSVERSGRAVAL